MPTIADIVAAKGYESTAIDAAADLVDAPAPDQGGGGGIDFGFLLTPTGPGSIDDYLEHPLNAKQSRGLAQVLRGATGLFGEGLRAALADILFGGMEYMRERRVAANAD